MSTATELAIGKVAEATGVPVTVIRYYQELGLIDEARRVGGKRRFDQSVVPRIAFVKRAQDAGFSLDDIKALLNDTDGKWAAIVDRQLADLRDRRRELDAMISTLEEARRCSCLIVADCPAAAASR